MMRIMSNNFNFGNSTKVTQNGGIRVTEEFNDNHVKVMHREYDVKNDRFLRQDRFDDAGNVIENWWFEYSKNKKVEHFESKKSESYIRTFIDKIVDGLQVRTEEFVSKTKPENNYLYEITRNFDGKMKSFICNGKKVF